MTATPRQCPSCGGACGYTKRDGCRYVDRSIAAVNKEPAPERIYNWLNGPLSIARHYGGCSFNGAEYVISYGEDGQPLVRKDLIAKSNRKKKPPNTR